jgi:hypothetical protein
VLDAFLLTLATYGFVFMTLAWTVFVERDRDLSPSLGEPSQKPNVGASPEAVVSAVDSPVEPPAAGPAEAFRVG